ncbi:MAG: hypothetical protein NC548_39795 [Lachnospiraceae bacterium]|nr:hypothetical protein [Lachnospiraceae bacterium]
MIKPVTFQGQINFNANLYALEVKSRFIDQNNAHGYYTGYGDELAATVVGGNQIQVGTGAFVVCARMAEITAPEMLRPQIFDGFKGYVVARIETYHPADEGNVTLIAKIQTTWEALNRELEQNDVYAAEADNVNTAFELPIYSFEISGTQITKLTRLIKPVCDYATMKAIVDNALATAQNAVTTANNAVTTSNDASAKAAAAVSTANGANTKSDNAVSTANAAAENASEALDTANGLNAQIVSANDTAAEAVETADGAAAEANAATLKVNELEKQIAEKQGTKVTLNGEPQATYPADDLVHNSDKIEKAAHADNADNANAANEAGAASTAIYAFTAAEAEKAVGYTRGGEIDKALKSIIARLTALEGGN